MIPCEEIIIPNAVVPGQDVYQGPSNIYLAFPMENNGNGGVHSTGAPTASNASGSNSNANAAVTSCGNSTNSTPPQAQSPQTSSSATGACILRREGQTLPAFQFYISDDDGAKIRKNVHFSRITVLFAPKD